MVNNSFNSQSIKFGDVLRLNIQDVRKFCLETCVSVLVCFVKFYVLFLVQMMCEVPKMYTRVIEVDTSEQNSLRTDERVLK